MVELNRLYELLEEVPLLDGTSAHRDRRTLKFLIDYRILRKKWMERSGPIYEINAHPGLQI